MSSSPSIIAFTLGNSCSAVAHAFRKNDIIPSLIPCFSTKLFWYFLRNSMIGFISTSLKVVSIAVSFFTDTRRSLSFLRKELNRSRRISRLTGFFSPPPNLSVPACIDASTSSRFSRRRPLITSSTDRSFSSITFFANGVIFT